jgi:hypothetical protein
MLVVAYGRSTSYDAYGATFYYNSISTISTTTINAIPTGATTHLWVYAAAVAIIVPTGTVAPTTISNAYGATTTPAFHLGPLSMTVSIVILVVGGLVVLLILGAFCLFCRRRPYRSPSPMPAVVQRPISFPSNQPRPPVYPSVSHSFQSRSVPPVPSSKPTPSPANDYIDRLRRAQEEQDEKKAADARRQTTLDARKAEIAFAAQQKKEEKKARIRREIEDEIAEEGRRRIEADRRREAQIAVKKAKIQEAERQKTLAKMKRNPIRSYRMKVTWDAPDEANYENTFDDGPTYGAPYFEVEGKTSLPQRKRRSERRRLTGFAFPIEQTNTSVSPTTRPIGKSQYFSKILRKQVNHGPRSQTPAPKRPNEHLPYNGPKLQVNLGGTTLDENAASSPQLATSRPESEPVPSSSTSSTTRLIPRKPTPSTQVPPKPPGREDSIGRGSGNILPRDKPTFAVNVGGDTFEDREDIPVMTGAMSGPAPENLEEALFLELLGGRRR